MQRLAGDRAIADTTLSIPHPYEDGVAEQWIATHQELFEAGALVNFAITLAADGNLLGALGLHIVRRDDRAELSYWIGKPHWNQGYATETAHGIMHHGFEQLNLNRIQAHHILRNPASGRVLQKIGMQREGVFRQYIRKWNAYEDIVGYAILRDEYYQASHGH